MNSGIQIKSFVAMTYIIYSLFIINNINPYIGHNIPILNFFYTLHFDCLSYCEREIGKVRKRDINRERDREEFIKKKQPKRKREAIKRLRKI